MTEPSRGVAVPILCGLSAVGFAVSLWLAFVVAPPAQDLFLNQKIFYFHVAHAFTLFCAVFVAGGCSIMYLRTRAAKWDDIASFADLVKFFERLPNPDKQFAVMPGIAHASFHQKNYAICYHILESFFSQPAPIYKGGH